MTHNDDPEHVQPDVMYDNTMNNGCFSYGLRHLQGC